MVPIDCKLVKDCLLHKWPPKQVNYLSAVCGSMVMKKSCSSLNCSYNVVDSPVLLSSISICLGFTHSHTHSLPAGSCCLVWDDFMVSACVATLKLKLMHSWQHNGNLSNWIAFVIPMHFHSVYYMFLQIHLNVYKQANMVNKWVCVALK